MAYITTIEVLLQEIVKMLEVWKTTEVIKMLEEKVKKVNSR